MKLPSVKQAFFIHFGISLIIFIALAAIMRLVWYPGDLFTMDGGVQGLKIIAPIDLVLGPALTLGFYRPWKKSLKFDMAAIACVQIAALGYGVYATYQQRPAAIVFAENRFETLSYSEYKSASRQLTENDIEPRKLSEFGSRMPIMVHAKSFADEGGYGQYLADILNGLPELRERSDRYTALPAARLDIAEFRINTRDDGTTLAVGEDTDNTIEIPASSKSADTTQADSQEARNTTAEIYPLKARYTDGTIEFDPQSFNWIKIKSN